LRSALRKIFGLYITDGTYNEWLSLIRKSVADGGDISIGYCTAYTLNLSYTNNVFRDLLNGFSYLHADGIGIYLASKYLNGYDGFRQRINGSDLYPILAEEGIKESWKFFFLGDTNETLGKIKINYSALQIAGSQNGYNFISETVISRINSGKTDILIVGLGSPLQEEWVIRYKSQIDAKVILCVGDGIKVFAGIKERGNIIAHRLGFEWLVRLVHDPIKLWRRYLIGIPLFVYRIIIYKSKLNHGNESN